MFESFRKQACINARRTLVTAVIVSRDRPDELRKTINAVTSQEVDVQLATLIVDSSASSAGFDIEQADVDWLRSKVNLGGAGGFSLGILSAIASGAEWLWLMDDDGRPSDITTLRRLLEEAETGALEAIAPVVLDRDDPSRFAFPYLIGNHYIFRRNQIARNARIGSTAHLFNGLLVRSSVIFKIGLPDVRLFMRGDEIDFLYRMRRAKIRFGTTAAVTFTHPSSNNELFPVWGGCLHVVYPPTAWKRRTQYRNRGYNFVRNRRFIIIAVDFIRYPYFFLFQRRFDIPGLLEWLSCMWSGMRGHVFVEPAIDLTPRLPVGPVP